jgi:hypothetical protein
VYFMGMDWYWPNKSFDLGTKVTYKCPFGKETAGREREQISECVLDKDTDILSWSPPDILPCDRKYFSSLQPTPEVVLLLYLILMNVSPFFT